MNKKNKLEEVGKLETLTVTKSPLNFPETFPDTENILDMVSEKISVYQGFHVPSVRTVFGSTDGLQ